jgi:hypothetical protein
LVVDCRVRPGDARHRGYVGSAGGGAHAQQRGVRQDVCVVLDADALDGDELLGPVDRERAPHQRINDAPDCRVPTDSDREREDRGDGEARRTCHRAQGVARVGPPVFYEASAARVSRLFFYLFQSPQLDSRAAQRLVTRHAPAHEVIDGGIEVELQLRSQIALERAASKEARDPGHWTLRGAEDE